MEENTMNTLTQKDELLRALLNCGSMDLSLLDNVKYSWFDVLEQLDGLSLEDLDFNNLMRAVVSVGIIETKDALFERIEELETQSEINDDEKAELAALKTLDPDQDIEGYFNCLDTHVYFANNASVYRQYLSDAIDAFENNTGLVFDI